MQSVIRFRAMPASDLPIRLVCSALTKRCEGSAIVQELMLKYGSMLLRLELAGIVGAAAKTRIPDIASTFFQIALATGQQGQQWLQENINLLPDQCAQPEERQQFLRAVAQSCVVDPSCSEQMEQSIWYAACQADTSLCLWQQAWSALYQCRAIVCCQQCCNCNAACARNQRVTCRVVQRALTELAQTCRRNPRSQQQSEQAMAPRELWQDLQIA
jgi:hypothetical protein